MHSFERGETPNDRMALWTPQTWPGRPAPVVLVVPDSVRAVAAARWAARAAYHRSTDLALLVTLHCSSGSVPVELADEARAVTARVLPAAAAHNVVAHAVATCMLPMATERAATKAEVRAIASVVLALSAPLVVVCEDITSARGRRMLATMPADILFVPPAAVGRVAVVGTR